jgi:hypothetical protein
MRESSGPGAHESTGDADSIVAERARDTESTKRMRSEQDTHLFALRKLEPSESSHTLKHGAVDSGAYKF